MPLLKYLSTALNINEAKIKIIGNADEQRAVMSSYLLATREGVHVVGVPAWVDGTVVTVDLVGYNHSGEGEWLDEDAFSGFDGEFEEPDEDNDVPESTIWTEEADREW